jgi:CxxC motif-containing protein (DUF1111 family)
MRRIVAFSAVFFPAATAAVWASSPAGSPDLAAGIVRTAASTTAKTTPSTTTRMTAAAEEAPTGFDGQTIDETFVPQQTHDATDRVEFEQVQQISDGLGPVFNATSCVSCHQTPVTGAAAQVSELRAGHIDPTSGVFANPQIPIDDGKAVIAGRSLVNDRSICPNAEFPNDTAQEIVPASENIRTFRMALSLLGDGFVEAVADQTLLDLSKSQCTSTNGKVCGQAIQVPITEAPGQTAVGKFGWKDQHASLLSFSADAYVNEMGITNRLIPTEFTTICNPAGITEPNSSAANASDKENLPNRDGLDDIDLFARFMRATKAPARDAQTAGMAQVQKGEGLFTQVGCAMCHTPTLTTAAAGTKINGGQFTVPNALGNKIFHPFGDFLLHDVGTGDGIVQTPTEPQTQFKMRTAPLWGVRFRTRLMHDGTSSTLGDAILRHGGEAEGVKTQFQQLPDADQAALIAFLNSL